jgi:hypothetical protein
MAGCGVAILGVHESGSENGAVLLGLCGSCKTPSRSQQPLKRFYEPLSIRSTDTLVILLYGTAQRIHFAFVLLLCTLFLCSFSTPLCSYAMAINISSLIVYAD